MDRRQPLPRLWLMTDERQGEGLFAAIGRLPEKGGIVFRHYSLPGAKRRALFEEVRNAARDRILLLAGSPEEAAAWGAHGVHGWKGASPASPLRSLSAHNEAEIEEANLLAADLLFISPVFETRSHPDATALGVDGFNRLAAKVQMPVIALGGMNAERVKLLEGANIHGWAGIDAWSGD